MKTSFCVGGTAVAGVERQGVAGAGKFLPGAGNAWGIMDFLSHIVRYVDPVALVLVLGGAFGVAAMRSSREDLARAFAALGPLFRDRPEADAAVAMRAVNAIEALAQIRSIACADRVQTAGRFLRRAAFRLSDAATAQDFRLWAKDEIDARRRRHDGAAAVWRTIADAAPAMGMIGTIIGLVQMFAGMEDVAKIGPAMALAMLTTLYGIFLSGVIAGPVAARLERLSDAELAWQGWALSRLELLAHAELDGLPLRGRPHLRTVA